LLEGPKNLAVKHVIWQKLVLLSEQISK